MDSRLPVPTTATTGPSAGAVSPAVEKHAAPSKAGTPPIITSLPISSGLHFSLFFFFSFFLSCVLGRKSKTEESYDAATVEMPFECMRKAGYGDGKRAFKTQRELFEHVVNLEKEDFGAAQEEQRAARSIKYYL